MSQLAARWCDGVVLTTPRRYQGLRARIEARYHDFCLPHLHLTPPLGGGVPVWYCHAVWYGKTRMVWLPDGEKIWCYVYSFWQNSRKWQTDTAWRHRPHLHSIARQKLGLLHKTQWSNKTTTLRHYRGSNSQRFSTKCIGRSQTTNL